MEFCVNGMPAPSMKLTPTYTVSEAALTLACAISRYVSPGTMPAISWPAPPAPEPTLSEDVPELACPVTTVALPQLIQLLVPLSKPPFDTKFPEAGGTAANAAGAMTDCCASANAATG